MTRALLPLALLALASSTGCILEWVEWVQTLSTLGTAGDEHRVQDLRVLAIEAEPAELRYRLGVFEEGGDALPPLTLSLEAFAYDPRGGEIQTTLQLCPKEAEVGRFFNGAVIDFSACVGGEELGGLEPEVAAALAPIDRVLDADPTLPAGRIDGLTWRYVLTPAAQRAMLARAGVTDPVLHDVNVQVVLRVSREFAGQRETEWAVLPISMRADLLAAGDEELVERALEEEERIICLPSDPQRDCIEPAWIPPPVPGPSECGDEIVEGEEQCDPPDGLFCDDACQLLNVCERSCLAYTEPNERPRAFGFDRDVTIQQGQGGEIPRARLADVDDTDLPPGAELPVSPGAAVSLAVVLDAASRQLYALPGGGAIVEDPRGRPDVDIGDDERPPPPDEPPALPEQTRTLEEELATSWYIVGSDGAIDAPLTFDGLFVDQGFTGAIRYRTSVDRQAGDRDPIFVVVNDGRGGMDVVHVELVYE